MKDVLKLGLLIADENEYRPVADAFADFKTDDFELFGKQGMILTLNKDGRKIEIYMVLSGVGKINTAVCAVKLLQQCDILVNFGYCGGLGGLKKNDVIIGTSFVEHDFDVTALGYEPAEKPNQNYIYTSDRGLNAVFKRSCPEAKEGRIATGDSFVCEEATRDFLMHDLLAHACDMEAAAAAYAANIVDKPFLSFKLISDLADNDVMDDYRETADDASEDLSTLFKNFTDRLFECSEYFED